MNYMYNLEKGQLKSSKTFPFGSQNKQNETYSTTLGMLGKFL